MLRRAAVAASGLACLLIGLEARQGQQAPVFRGEIDIVRLDVSVLDKDRRPVTGLTIADFTVSEDGKPQQIVAVSEVRAGENDPTPTAWMRHTPRDVATNDLTDQLGEGRVFAILMDDFNTPHDDLEIVMASREIARYLVDQLGPSDLAAIVFPNNVGATQDFTDDRAKLLAAIDRFKPVEPTYIGPTPQGTGQGGGDMPFRYSSALARTQCERSQPTVPTLEAITSKLATVPNRRKTVVFVSTGVPMTFTSRDSCMSGLESRMLDIFRLSQRASINVHTIDPAGLGGYEQYLQDPRRLMSRFRRPMGAEGARRAAEVVHNFMKTTADYTGARAIVNTGVWGEIDEMLDEAASYYLVGYQSSNARADGKFRRVDVKVKRPGTTVRSRSGFYEPRAGSLLTEEQRRAPSSSTLSMAGMSVATTLPMRAIAVPIALVPGGRTAEVAVVATVRLPPANAPVNETLSLIRHVYNAEGSPGPPSEEKITLSLPAATGEESRYDVQQRLTMAPGRYEIRLSGTSAALGRSASVYAEVEVPDFTRAPVSASPIVLGARPGDQATRTDRLATLIPLVPTTARDFAGNDQIHAFVRVFQGGSGALAPIVVTVRILDVADAVKLDQQATLGVEQFDASRSAPFEMAVPLASLARGPYVLSLTAARPDGTSVRRDLVFRMR